MNIDRISLTKKEAQWFGRYVLKMIDFMQNAGKKDPKILERTTFKVLASLAEKAIIFTAADAEINNTNLSRKQKILMQDLIGGVIKNLTERVLPEYSKRGSGFEEDLVQGKLQKMFLETLSRKLR